MSDEQKMHHCMGIEMNIQTWKLLDKKDRNEKDNARMINFANASIYHWRKSPKYKPVNEQRGQWIISHVYAILGNGEEALIYAEETLRLTEKHRFKDFDLAYAYESMARAYAASGNKIECENWWKKSRKAGNLISDNEDKKIFDGDLNSGPWYDCK